MPREIRLNAFDMNCVGHPSAGPVGPPGDRPRRMQAAREQHLSMRAASEQCLSMRVTSEQHLRMQAASEQHLRMQSTSEQPLRR